MDNKTKEALKQLQAEVRQLQSLLTNAPAPTNGSAPGAENGGGPRKERSDSVVQYSVQYRLPGSDKPALKPEPMTWTAAQLGQVTDEEAAALGYGLSSPQKVALLRALLPKESESAAALGEATHLSTGSLYHHLRDLTHAGLIGQSGRNRYVLTERGRRVLLVMLALAAEK